MLEISKKYRPRKDSKYEKLRDDLLINAKNFYDGRKMIISAFKDKIFPLYSGYYSQQEDEISKVDSDDELIGELVDEKTFKEILDIGNKLDHELVKKYLKKESLLELLKFLYPSDKKNINSAKKLANEIGLSDLIKYMKNMSDDGVKSKNLDLMAHFAKKIFDTFKEQTGQGLKILTPKQMIIRLPILLAQLKTGNNSEKLKNEIRKIAYSLYR